MKQAEAKLGKTVHIVDDDEDFRTSLLYLLKSKGYVPTGYESGEQFLDAYTAQTSGCITLDIDFAPGCMNGIQVFECLLRRQIPLLVVFLTGPHGGDAELAIQQALKARWHRYAEVYFLPKSARTEILLARIDAFHAQEDEVRAVWRKDREHIRLLANEMTPRTRDVGQLVLESLTTYAISRTLNITEGTVEHYRAEFLHSLGGRPQQEVAGWLKPLKDTWDAETLADLVENVTVFRCRSFSSTEVQVLDGKLKGMSDAQIAKDIFGLTDPSIQSSGATSPRDSVRLHLESAFAQLDVQTLAEARKLLKWLFEKHHISDASVAELLARIDTKT